MNENLILDGLVLMVVGMSVVFAFLGLMIGAMNLCASFFIRFAHLFPETPKAGAKPAAQKAEDLTEIAVALAAVKARLS